MITFKTFNNYLSLITSLFNTVEEESLYKLFERILESFENSSTIFIAGNGGSASIASHASTDLNKLEKNGKYLNVVSLSTNIPNLMAIGNDNGFENIFTEQMKNFCLTKNDFLITISSSGNSQNIINLIKLFNAKDLDSYSLSGFSGGEVVKVAKNNIFIESPDNYYGPVEDLHMMIFHYFAHMIKQDIKEIY